MKWFFTTNEASLDNPAFFKQMQVAVISASRNTSLKPHLVYDGQEHSCLRWLRDNGVTILQYKLPFYDELAPMVAKRCSPEMLPVRSGAYLKMEIPAAVKQYGIPDKYVFYTDCDVVFLKDVALQRLKPRFLAAHGNREGGRTRFRIGGWKHINSGVLLMNVDALHGETERFRKFVLNNGNGTPRPPSAFMQKHLSLSDQVAINLFYRGRIDTLKQKYNWHPTTGVSHMARIIHFNGLKWTQWDDFLQGRLLPENMAKFTRLVNKDRAAFEHYVKSALYYHTTQQGHL